MSETGIQNSWIFPCDYKNVVKREWIEEKSEDDEIWKKCIVWWLLNKLSALLETEI